MDKPSETHSWETEYDYCWYRYTDQFETTIDLDISILAAL